MMVLESARERLNTLSTVAAQLNDASDRYTEELKTIESELNALCVGLSVTLNQSPILVSANEEEISDRGDVLGVIRTAHYLGYERHGSCWRIVVHRDKEWMEGEDLNDVSTFIREDTSPLAECSREIRLASASHILDLLDELYTEAKEKVASLQKVMDTRKS